MTTTRTITMIRIFSATIALIGAVVSYGTQRGLLLHWGMDHLAGAAIPVTVDLLAIICALAIHTPGVDPTGRRVAYRVLALAGTVSVGANALAGETIGSRIAHVWCVLAYLAAEAVAAKTKCHAVTVDPQLTAAHAELATAQDALADAQTALAAAEAAAEQARTDAARRVRDAQAKARKAIREATATAPAPQQTRSAPAAPASKLWTPGDLEAVYALPSAPVSPAG